MSPALLQPNVLRAPMKSAGSRLIRKASFKLGEGCRFGEPRSDLVCHHSQLPTQPFNVVCLKD